MPRDYFNSPFTPRTDANAFESPHAWMFERLVSDMQSTLEEEVLFDDTGWPDGFDWHNDADAAWDGIAEDARMLARFPAHASEDRLLARSAGLVLRAIRGEAPEDLEDVLIRFSDLMLEHGAEDIHFLLHEATASIEEMFVRAQRDDPDGPDHDLICLG